MTIVILLLVPYLVVSAGLFYTAFCRLAMTNSGTLMKVRGTLWALAAFGAGSIACTVIYGYMPGAFHILILLLLFAMQIATRHRWMKGVPSAYCKRSRRDQECWLTNR